MIEAEIPERFVAMQAPRRRREPWSKATCPLTDPDTVANISFVIGTGVGQLSPVSWGGLRAPAPPRRRE